MKLVDLTCTGCGANVKVDPSIKVATCTVCGKQMLIEHTGEFGAGYEREMGRIQAQRDVEEQWKQERDEKIRQIELEKKQKEEKQEMDRIKKQLQIICAAEGVVCFLLLFSSFFIPDKTAQTWFRVPFSFMQLALIAAITFFFSRDKYFTQISLSCIFCAILCIISSFFSGVIVWYAIFNIIKLIFMIRVERVKYSWKEIADSMKWKK